VPHHSAVKRLLSEQAGWALKGYLSLWVILMLSALPNGLPVAMSCCIQSGSCPVCTVEFTVDISKNTV
jgi:hypothetical protein